MHRCGSAHNITMLPIGGPSARQALPAASPCLPPCVGRAPPPASCWRRRLRAQHSSAAKAACRAAAEAGTASAGAAAAAACGAFACADVDVSSSSAEHAPSNGSASNGSPGTQAAPESAAQRGTQPHAGEDGEAASAAAAAAAELGVPAELLPAHVAVIMDGNSRWAAARGLPAAAGHRAGVGALKRCVRACHRWGVRCLTVYAFSAENWQRPAAEVGALLALMERTLTAEVAELAARGVRLRFIGQRDRLPPSLQRAMASAEAATAGSARLHLTVALSYSGRADLAAAAAQLAAEAAAGRLAPEAITPELLGRRLATRGLPPAWREPDLLIRTSGEQRLSNFLCWEAAYAELLFSPALWPDFGEKELGEALREYARRERRFGGRRHADGGGASESHGGAPLQQQQAPAQEHQRQRHDGW